MPGETSQALRMANALLVADGLLAPEEVGRGCGQRGLSGWVAGWCEMPLAAHSGNCRCNAMLAAPSAPPPAPPLLREPPAPRRNPSLSPCRSPLATPAPRPPSTPPPSTTPLYQAGHHPRRAGGLWRHDGGGAAHQVRGAQAAAGRPQGRARRGGRVGRRGRGDGDGGHLLPPQQQRRPSAAACGGPSAVLCSLPAARLGCALCLPLKFPTCIAPSLLPCVSGFAITTPSWQPRRRSMPTTRCAGHAAGGLAHRMQLRVACRQAGILLAAAPAQGVHAAAAHACRPGLNWHACSNPTPPHPLLQAAAAEAGAVEGVAPSATNNAALHHLQELFAHMKALEVGCHSAASSAVTATALPMAYYLPNAGRRQRLVATAAGTCRAQRAGCITTRHAAAPARLPRRCRSCGRSWRSAT